MSDRNTRSEAEPTAWAAGTVTAEGTPRAAEDTAAQAGREASRMAGDIRDQAADTAESGKNQAADRLEGAADAIHRSADALRGREDWLAELVDRGADGLAAFAGSVRGNDLRGTLSRIERMARDQPTMLVGASMAAGFALVRLGRAGMEQAGTPAGKRYGDGR